MISLPVISEDSSIQAFYVQMREEGQSHKLAELLALREGPHLSTDTRFMANTKTLRDQFPNEDELMRVVKQATKQGYTPKSTDFYDGNLATKCGDPAAFIPHDNPKAHVRKVCEKRDWTCHGPVEVKRKSKG